MILLAAVLGASCIAVTGDHVTAADLSRALPEFSTLAPEQALAYAPAPGARRTVTARELARWANQRGVTLSHEAQICIERATERLKEARVVERLRAAIADPAVRIELIDFSRYPVPLGELEFPRSGLGALPVGGGARALLWRGRMRYGENRSIPVWARVKLAVAAKRIVAVENLVAGKPIQSAQVRLETAEICPLAEAPVAALEQAAGRIPKRIILAGTPVFPSMLAILRDVERGDTVSVEVSSGGARLVFHARAESAGSAGDTVYLRNPLNGRRFPGRVQGRGKVKVDAEKNDDTRGGTAAVGSERGN